MYSALHPRLSSEMTPYDVASTICPRPWGRALASQIEIHAPWGGVVPNLAQEAHKEAIHGRDFQSFPLYYSRFTCAVLPQTPLAESHAGAGSTAGKITIGRP